MLENTCKTIPAKHVDTGYDDLIYEVKMKLVNAKGEEREEHWFEGTRVEAETRKMNLSHQYANMYNSLYIKIQPHILK